ncbi:MAG TPA: MFS transporter [Acidimicrobiales bacterium]|nr:MFS transporter [Acidimicrobiales bacterium]
MSASPEAPIRRLPAPGSADPGSAGHADLRWPVVAIMAVFFAHGLLFASWTAHIPETKASLDLSAGTLGLALLAAPIGSVLAMLAAGWLVPRLGSRRMVRVTLVGYAAAGPVVGLCGSVAAFFVAFLVWGAFQGALDVSMNAQAIAVERRSRQPRMPGFHGGWSLGSLVGALVGALGVGVGLALDTQLLILAVPVLVVVGWLTTRLVPDSHPTAVPTGSMTGTPPGPPSGTPAAAPGDRSRRFGVLCPAVVVLGLVALADMLCEGVAADWAAVYFRDSLRTTAFVAGSAYVVYLVAMTICRLSGNRLVGWLRSGRLVPGLLVVGGAGFAVGLAVDRPWAVLAGFGLLGAGLALVVPTAFTAAGAIPGVPAGRAVAAVSAFGWVGFVAGPPLIGLLASASSLRVALVVVPVLVGVLVVATAVALRSD